VLHSAQTQQKRKYGKTVSLGAKQAQLDEICITVHSSLIAGDFFDSLQKIPSDHGVEFRKESNIVENFPDTIFVTIRAFVSQCGEKSSHDGEIKKEIDLMESLHFAASWKSGSETREIPDLSVKRSAKTSSAFYHDWLYQLSIPSQNIPLTDHLKVSIFTKDGKRVVAFTAAL